MKKNNKKSSKVALERYSQSKLTKTDHLTLICDFKERMKLN